MQAVAVSLFRFDRTTSRLWAFSQMQLARPALRELNDVGFVKLLGTGTGEGFTPVPNFGVYAILTTWPSLDIARSRLAKAPVFERYREHAQGHWTLYLSTLSSRGAWDGKRPFEPTPAKDVRPVVALTRATVRPSAIWQFWKRVPNISADVGRDPSVLFKIGMGEMPWFQQVTFSIWPDTASMRAFAERSHIHGEAAKAALTRGWFKEDLYARFEVQGMEGSWGDTSNRVAAAVGSRATADDRGSVLEAAA